MSLFLWERSLCACESVCLSRPLSQLPVLSVAGLIGVTTGQAVVTATELFTALIGQGGKQQVATSNQRSTSGHDLEGVFGGRVKVQAYSHTHIHKLISHTRLHDFDE